MKFRQGIDARALRGFHKDLVAVLVEADAHNWSARAVADGGIIIRSPDKQHSFRIGMRNSVDPSFVRQVRRAIRSNSNEVQQEEAQPVAAVPEQEVEAVVSVTNETRAHREERRELERQLQALPGPFDKGLYRKGQLLRTLHEQYGVAQNVLLKMVVGGDVSRVSQTIRTARLMDVIRESDHTDENMHTLVRLHSIGGFPASAREVRDAYVNGKDVLSFADFLDMAMDSESLNLRGTQRWMLRLHPTLEKYLPKIGNQPTVTTLTEAVLDDYVPFVAIDEEQQEEQQQEEAEEQDQATTVDSQRRARMARLHVRESVTCQLCGATFSSRASLGGHMKTHRSQRTMSDADLGRLVWTMIQGRDNLASRVAATDDLNRALRKRVEQLEKELAEARAEQPVSDDADLRDRVRSLQEALAEQDELLQTEVQRTRELRQQVQLEQARADSVEKRLESIKSMFGNNL